MNNPIPFIRNRRGNLQGFWRLSLLIVFPRDQYRWAWCIRQKKHPTKFSPRWFQSEQAALDDMLSVVLKKKAA